MHRCVIETTTQRFFNNNLICLIRVVMPHPLWVLLQVKVVAAVVLPPPPALLPPQAPLLPLAPLPLPVALELLVSDSSFLLFFFFLRISKTHNYNL